MRKRAIAPQQTLESFEERFAELQETSRISHSLLGQMFEPGSREAEYVRGQRVAIRIVELLLEGSDVVGAIEEATAEFPHYEVT